MKGQLLETGKKSEWSFYHGKTVTLLDLKFSSSYCKILSKKTNTIKKYVKENLDQNGQYYAIKKTEMNKKKWIVVSCWFKEV